MLANRMMFRSKKGFTLIELLIVIAIIGILAAIIIVNLSAARTKSRDAKRKSDINNIKTALDLYFDANESYPTVDSYDVKPDGTYNTSWDRSDNNDGTSSFMSFLTQAPQNYMSSVPVDPINNSTYYYRYHRYGAGSNGCTNPFYILQIKAFESDQYRNAPDHGAGSCPGDATHDSRDWVTGIFVRPDGSSWTGDPNLQGYTIQVFEK